jgi:hypothetical protein
VLRVGVMEYVAHVQFSFSVLVTCFSLSTRPAEIAAANEALLKHNGSKSATLFPSFKKSLV